jgi:hypothetical protein
VDEDEGLFAGIGLDVLEDLLLGVEEGLAFLRKRYLYGLGHLVLLLVVMAT